MTKRRLGPFFLSAALGLATGCHRESRKPRARMPPRRQACPGRGPLCHAARYSRARRTSRRWSPACGLRSSTSRPCTTSRCPKGDFAVRLDPLAFPSRGVAAAAPGGDQVYRQKALGSGFIVDSAGHVVTNAHVVEDADAVRVKLADDREFDAKVIGRRRPARYRGLELVGARKLPRSLSGRAKSFGWANTWSPLAIRLASAIR